MKLYKLQTKLSPPDYWVIAKDPTDAEIKLKDFLGDYGFSDNRKVVAIFTIAESAEDLRFISGKHLVI